MRIPLAFAALGAVLLAAGAADATAFSGSYRLDQINTSDPGLVLATQNLAGGGMNFSLGAVGDSVSINLFKLYTPETSVDPDDLVAKPISVGFAFLSPSGVTGADVTGATKGERLLLGLVQDGVVNWNGAQTYSFGDGGQFLVTLNNATFDKGAFGLRGEAGRGATIAATFTLISAASWDLMIGGFGLAGVALRRRTAFAAV
jgi:hypothetical protein